jgi:hypothetical protein
VYTLKDIPKSGWNKAYSFDEAGWTKLGTEHICANQEFMAPLQKYISRASGGCPKWYDVYNEVKT